MPDKNNSQSDYIAVLEEILCEVKTTAIKDYTKFLIEKSVKGKIYTLDLIDHVYEFLEVHKNGN